MVTAKGIRLRRIAEALEREAAELRRLADLEDNVARVTKASAKAKPKKKAKAKKVAKKRAVKKAAKRAKGVKRAGSRAKASKRQAGRGRL